MGLFCSNLQSFDICGRVSAIRKALVMLCSSQVRVEYSLSAQEYADVSFKQISSGSIFLFHSELWSEGRQSAVQRGGWHLRNLSGWFQRPRTPPLSGEDLASNIIEETVMSFPTVIAKKIGTKKKTTTVFCGPLKEPAIHWTLGLCPPPARVLWGVSVSVVRPGEDVSAVPLHHHREPAVLEGRDHLGPLPDLLSCLFSCLLIQCAVIIWNHTLDNSLLF